MIKDDNYSLPDDPAILRQMLIQRDQIIQLLQTENELKSRENDTLKNTVELKGAHAAHQRDAVAVINFLAWLDQNVFQIDRKSVV